jgi:20S proteasome alpha/beta subunit
MTVCIGSLARNKQIVMVCDRLLSMGSFSVDTATLKLSTLHVDWVVLFAADDTGIVPIVLREIQNQFSDHADFDTPVEIDVIVSCLREGFQKTRRMMATDKYLSTYGLTLEEFLRDGAAKFGNTGFALLRQQIEQCDLGCELLVCGFDDTRASHVLTVNDPGIVKEHNVAGYWAVGSGAYQAIGTLASRGHNGLQNLESAVYNLCEAKFAAESAPGVGKETVILVIGEDHSMSTLRPDEIASLRKEWEAIGKPRKLRTKAKELIEQSLRKNASRLTGPNRVQTSKPTSSSSDKT